MLDKTTKICIIISSYDFNSTSFKGKEFFMKNVFLVFLGGLLLTIVVADWNSATRQVNAMLMVIGFAALGTGILADVINKGFLARLLSMFIPPMARYINEVPLRGASRWGKHYKG